MAIYLSVGMLDELSERLVQGGYSPDTSVAIVYKATWPEEKSIICTIRDMAEKARIEQIAKTAVVLVGDAISHRTYERSKLYDPTFTTQFREGRK
jgi:precorrin-4/cobalt-precorrin-4 C11-methyltransferase